MFKNVTDPVVARKAADAITDHWLQIPSRAHGALVRELTSILGASDCPECEVCCAFGLCCPLGSEPQRNALALLVLRDGK